MKLITIAQLLTPPLFVRIFRKIKPKKEKGIFDQSVGEKEAEWYDQSFTAKEHWRKKYNQSPHYFIWTVIVDRLFNSRNSMPKIMELGCGSGQLATLFADHNLKNYVGIDFSKERIKFAQQSCDGYNFICADFFSLDFDEYDYDTVICLETLEHIEDDTRLIEKIKAGTNFIGSVPDFPFVSHVRHFKNIDEVSQRYSKYFNDFSVHSFLDIDSNQNFLISGLKK